MAAAEAPAGPLDDTDAAQQALALVVGSGPNASHEPEDLAALLQTSRAVRARLQRTSGHTRINLGLPLGPGGNAPASEQAFNAAVKVHAARLAAFARWLPPHAALVAHLNVECINSETTQPLVDAFQRCAAAAAAAPAAQPPQPREGRVTRRAAAAARKLPPAAAVPLQLRSLAIGFRPPAELLSALAGSSSLTHLALHIAGGLPPAPGLAAALPHLRGLRSLVLSGSLPDAAPALAQLSSLASLTWRDLAWPQLGPLLAQLPASLGTLLLDLDVTAMADDDPRTEIEWPDEPCPEKLQVDVSGLQGLRSLDVTAAEWDDDGHAFWHGTLVPSLPPGLTRLVMHGRSEAVRGATSALQELSLTEWWFDTDDLATLISTAAPSLRSLHLAEYGPDNHQRDYETKDQPMTAAEGAALAAAIGSATQLTRLVLQVADVQWLHPSEDGPNSTSAALQPGFTAALANLTSLQVLVTNMELDAASVTGLTTLTHLSVLHLNGSSSIEPPAAIALCGALRRMCDLSLCISSSATGSASPLLSAAAQLTGLTRLQLIGGDQLEMTAADLELLRPLRQLCWATLPHSLICLRQQAMPLLMYASHVWPVKQPLPDVQHA